MNRKVVVPAAKIDLVSEEELALFDESLACRLLPANLAADSPHVVHREADAAKHHRAGRPAVGYEPVVVGDVILEDELADLAVVQVEGTNACADVGSDSAATDGQEPHGRGERDDAQLEILFDLGAVVAHLLRVQTVHGVLVEADAESRFEVVAYSDDPLA